MCNIYHDPLVAIVTERNQVDLDLAVALIEPACFLIVVPDTANPATNKHQIALFGSQDGFVPIHDGYFVVRAHQDIAAMKV